MSILIFYRLTNYIFPIIQDMGEIHKKLGRRIRELRKIKGWSQEKLASKAGLHFTYIGAIERGERNITLENIEKLAAALDVRIDDLLKFSGNSGKETGLEDVVVFLKNKRPKDIDRIRKVIKAMFEK